MAQAIRIHCTIESDTLKLPEVSSLVGKRVEIIVIEEEAEGAAPNEATKERRPVLGSLRGLMKVPDDFDDPLPPEVLRAFEGSDEA